MGSVEAVGGAVVLAVIAVALLTMAHMAHRGWRASSAATGRAETAEQEAYWAAVRASGDLSDQERVVDEVTFAAMRRAYLKGTYQGLESRWR